jgi:hypothetical protein
MILETAVKAVRIYAESHPRPSCVTLVQAAEMLGISHVTAQKLIASGKLSRNGIGLIPTAQVDRLLEAGK